MARRIAAQADDKVTLVNDKGSRELFKVVDIYQSGISAYDDQTVFLELKNAEAFFAVDGPNEFSIKLDDPNQAEEYGLAIRQMTGLVTNNWLTENASMKSELERRRLINVAIMGTMFLVAAFGIANIMLMSTLGKRRDIAIMQAFGITKAMVTGIYLTQGLILGALGSLLGGAFGALMTWVVGQIPVSFNVAITRQGFPITWETGIFLLPMGGGLLISVLASVFPARKAASFQPAEVIRHG